MRFRLWLVLLLPGMVLLGACTGPSESTDTQGPAAEEEPAPADDQRSRVSVADYETFNATAYPVRAPEQTVEVTHEVPKRLMASRAAEGVKQTVEGFRVQVFSAQEQEAAQEFREEVRQWWKKTREEAPDDVFSKETPIVIEYSQPYYRVRVGAFAKRDEAADALEFIRESYPEAFVAQSTVTVVR